MFRFGEPQYLYLLIVLPLLAVFYFYSNYRRRKKLREYGSPELLAHLMPDVSKYRPDVKFWLTLSALAMVIFMLARPQFGSKMETVKRQGWKRWWHWIFQTPCWHRMLLPVVWKNRRS